MWARRTMSPACDAAGNRRYIISVVEDITERKEMESALRESEGFARATIDGLTEHICVVDDRGVIVIANKAWRRFAAERGLSEAQRGEGANYFDICEHATGMQKHHAKSAVAGIREVLEGGRPEFSLEYACRSALSERWFSLRATLFPGDETPARRGHAQGRHRARRVGAPPGHGVCGEQHARRIAVARRGHAATDPHDLRSDGLGLWRPLGA